MYVGEDRNVQPQEGVWLCCVRGLGGDLQFCNVFHVVLIAVSHEQLECKESLFPFWYVGRNSSTSTPVQKTGMRQSGTLHVYGS